MSNLSSILATLAGDGRFAYQCEPAERLAQALETHGGALNASEMGIGKTSTCLAAALLLGRPFSVVCPAACIPGWERMARHFGVEALFIESFETIRSGKSEWYDGQRWLAGPVGRDFVLIVDEAQNCKGMDTAQGKMLLAAARQEIRVLMISATIAENPAEMKGSGMVLGLHDGTRFGFERWIQQHGCQWDEDYNRWVFPKSERFRLGMIHQRIFGGAIPRGIRVTREQLGGAFPTSDVQFVEVEMPGDVTTRIEGIWAECHRFCERLEKQKGTSARTLIRIKQGAWARAFEASQTAKVPWLVQEVPQRVAEGYSVPVFVNYTSSRESLMTGLGTVCGIYGGQSSKAREARRLDFQQDRQRVIACQIQSGGTGLDLHDIESAHRRWSYIMPCPKWALIEQATGRVWRAGGGHSIQRIPYAKGTVEVRMCAKARERIANMKMIVEGEGDLVLCNEEFKEEAKA